jgi:hypothetical protein
VPPDDAPDAADRATLERLALANWSPAAEARVESVVVAGRSAAVNLLVNGDYEYSAIFRRDERGDWFESSSSSGHVQPRDLGWLDAD